MSAPSILAFQTTAGDNDDAVTGVNWLENQAPSTVNDSARAMMARIAWWRDWLAGNVTQGGASNAYTFTSGETLTAYSNSLRILWKPNATSTGAVTLNVDGIGAKKVYRPDGTQAGSGDILANTFLDVVYVSTLDSSNGGFQIIGGIAEATALSMSAQYRLVGRSSSGAGLSEEIASSADMFALLGSANYAAARSAMSLTSLATTTPGTGVATALGVNVGSAGAFVVNGGALGTPLSGVLTNCTGLPNASVVGLGTAALKNTGTSGNNVPLLDGANTWSAAQIFQGDLYIIKATPKFTLTATSTNIPAIELQNASRYDDIRNTTSGFSFRYDTSGTPKEMLWNGTNLTLNSVAVPTISSSDTLSNKTLSSPTLSGTPLITGAPSLSNNVGLNGKDTGGTARNLIKIDASDRIQIGLTNNNLTVTGFEVVLATYGNAAALTALNTTGELVGSNVGPTSVYSLGYRGAPLRSVSASTTLVLADAGGTVDAGMSAGSQTVTIPPNSSVAFPIGTAVVILSPTGASTFTIVEGSGVTLRRGDGTAATGTRTVAQASIVTLIKRDTNEWYISGVFT